MHLTAKRFTHKIQEFGYTMIEMLAVLAIMGLLGAGTVKIYNKAKEKTMTDTVAKQIQAIATDHKINNYQNPSASNKYTIKGSYGKDLTLEDGMAGNLPNYFWIRVPASETTFCENLKKSKIIQADLITVNKELNGTCPGEIIFYFQKKKTGNTVWYTDEQGKQHLCPENATCTPDSYECVKGYYKGEKDCTKCPEHVTDCTDENTPTDCEEGYELIWGNCIIPPQACTTDTDCSACGDCDTEAGYCQNECPIPEPEEEDCGKNECIVYDEATQTCQDKCKRVEFLESTGTQYIDTGIIPNQNTKLEGRMKSPSLSNSTNFYGGGGTDYKTELSAYMWNNYLQVHNGNGEQGDCPYYVDTWFTHTNSKGTRTTSYENGKSCTLSGTGTKNFGKNSVVLFGVNRGSISISKNPTYISSFKIYDGAELVRDFIPVISPDKHACMFDKVSEKLFCNEGSGPDFLTYDVCGEDAHNDCFIYDNESQSCQNKCKQVTWLQSSGTQWIDSGIAGNMLQSNTLEISLKFNLLAYTRYGGLFGNYVDQNTNTWRILQQDSNTTSMWVYANSKAANASKTITNITKNAIHTITDTRSNVIVDGTSYPMSNTTGSTNTTSIAIFRQSSSSNSSQMRLYYFKVKDNGNLIRDFVPVLAPNGRPALFDQVEKKLYYNKGTGEFTTD